MSTVNEPEGEGGGASAPQDAHGESPTPGSEAGDAGAGRGDVPASADARGADDAPTAATEARQTEAAPARLRPARLRPEELDEKPEYMPRVRWGWIVGGISLVLALAIGYEVRDDARTEALRAQLLATHERELTDLSGRYRTFRERLERWTIEAASAGEPDRWVDPRLRISGLHSGEGIYLRLLATDATSPAGIERGASVMEEDALTRCLGIAPASARGLYSSGRFLTTEFVDEIRAEPELMRLRVLDEMLASSMTSDVPVVSTLLRAEYFLLVVQQGETRRDSPVDVYLWDLREERQLLRARFQARGVLLPVRIDSILPGIAMPPEPPGRPSMTSAGATDCSIASQIKGLTGESPVEISSDIAAAMRDDDATRERGEGSPPSGPPDRAAPSEGPAAGDTPAPGVTGDAPPAAAPGVTGDTPSAAANPAEAAPPR